MASPPSSTQTLGDRSCFKPTVTLYDWWLVKSEDNGETRRLAVAGVASAPEEAPRRVFCSAPISKTYDVFTLETTDGICVILEGLINKQQTVANGFPDEVAKDFQLGFYAGWEKGVAEFLGRDSNGTGVSGRISTGEHFSQDGTRTPYEHIGSSYFQSIFGRSKSLEGSQKDPMSRCSMKHMLIPSSDAVESVGGASGATVQSGEKMIEPERCPSNSARRVTRFLSEFLSSKWKNQQTVGNGLNSEKKTTDSVLTVSETVNNFLQNDKCEVQGKGVNSPSPTYVHPSIEEDSHEQVLCENMCDADFPNQLSSKLSLNSSVNDLVNHAAEETDKEDFGSTGLQCIGTLKTLEENGKNPVPGCLIKHDSTKVGPLNDEGLVASGVTTPSAGEIDTSMTSLRNYGGRVSRELSIVTRSKSKTKQIFGNGWNSDQNKMDSVAAVETVSNTSQNVECTVGGRCVFESFLCCCEMTEAVRNSSPTSVQLNQEIRLEPVSEALESLDGAFNANSKSGGKMDILEGSTRLDVEDPKQISTNLYSESTIDDPKVDDLTNLAAEVEKDTENIGLTEFRSVGRPETREENEKNPAPEPVSEALESLDGASNANSKSGGKMDILEGSTSHFAGRVSQLFSGIVGRKWKKKQTVGGLNSETDTIGSVPAVSGSMSNRLQDDGCEAVGNGMSRPSDFDLQEPMDVNVVRKLDFDFVEDDMQQTSNAEEGDSGTVTDQVGVGEIGGKEEKKIRERNRRQVTVHTQEIHVTVEVNKRKSPSLSILEVKKKKDATSVVNKKRKVSPSTSEVSKKKKFTPSTLEVNSKKKVSLSIPKVNKKKRKVSPSLEVSKRKPLTRSTQEVNSKKEVSLSTPEVNTKNRKVSPSTLEVSKKNKLRPTLEVNKKIKVSLSTLEMNTKISIISPESLSTRRSRSGRLQLPPLEFWRNQSPIYDKDHGIIGIQEELPKVTPSKGSRSEPRKRVANRG